VATLRDEAYAPITSTLCFVDASLDRVSKALVGWLRQLGTTASAETLAEQFPEVLHQLEPLTFGWTPRELLVATRSNWTAYFDCSARGTDTTGAVPYLCRLLSCRGVTVDVIPHTPRSTPDGRLGSMQFGLLGPTHTILNNIRSVAAVHNGDRWEFVAVGEPQPYEELDRYRARRIQDRLTPEMIERYCRALGIEAFDPAFYRPEAVLVRSDAVPTEYPTMSLQEAQQWLGILTGPASGATQPRATPRQDRAELTE
jgi:hypothetical protein